MCTGILIKTKKGEIIYGRTLEFSIPLIWKQFIFKEYKGTCGKFENDNKWYMVDGINNHGLFVASFISTDNKEYINDNLPNKTNILSSELNRYLLKNCNSVKDVKIIIEKINIKLHEVNGKKFNLNWLVCDKKGNCIVLEVDKGELNYYSNKTGIMTNGSSFTKKIESNKKLMNSRKNIEVKLPGDMSDISRFIKASYYLKKIPSVDNLNDGILYILNILHNFEIPPGHNENATEYSIAYSLNNFEMEYSQYGYKKVDNVWKITNLPVELSYFNSKKKQLNYNYLLNILPLTVLTITGMIYYSKR